MAGNKIRGITIEIAGDTSKLSKSLRTADSALRDTQKQLTDVNKLLKLDPKNTELLRQKTELLNKSIEQSKDKVENLKEAQAALGERTADNAKEYDAIEREIIACENAQKNWQKELDSMTPKVKTLQDSLKDVSKTTGEWSEKTKALSLAAGAAAGGLLANAFAASATADDYNTLARNTGFTVEELQKMKYASDFVDVSFESMTGTVTKLTKNMQSNSDAFDKLGVSIKDQYGNMRDVDDVFYDTLTALSKVSNETERDQLAMELFGKSAMDLSGIIDDGGAALKEYGNEASEAGLILSGDTLQAANALNDQVDKLKATTSQALLKAGAELATVLAPAIETAVNAISGLLSWFSNLDGSTQAMIVTVLGLVAAISPVLGIISAITGAAAALNVAVLPMIATIAAIVVGIAALVAAGVWLYQNWDLVKQKASELWQALQTAWNGIVSDVTNAWNNIVTFVTTMVTNLVTTVRTWFQTLAQAIKNKVDDAKTAVSNAFTAIKTAISDAITSAKTTVQTMFENIRSTVKEKVDAAKTAVTDAFEGIKSEIKKKLDDAWNTVTDIVEKIKGAFNFEWSLPAIKVPKIIVKGGKAPYGLGGMGEPPSIDVQWNKRGYIDGVLFNSPTVLPTANGLQGFGDGQGAELVVGLNRLRELIATSTPASNNVNINVYAAPGMDEEQVANAVALRLDKWLGSRL